MSIPRNGARLAAVAALLAVLVNAGHLVPRAQAGPPAQAAPPTAADVAQVLERDAIGWWFRRAVDPSGGFFETYDDASARPLPGGPRTAVFQSRLTWTAASAHAAGLSRPDRDLRADALHGLAFLRDRLVRPDGAVLWSITPRGEQGPAREDELHVYAMAFTIYAAAAVEEAAPGQGGLDVAKSVFRWLEANARDHEHGGYLEAFDPDGTPRLSAVPATPDDDGRNDAIGTRYGFKSMNSHIHLLEAFTALYRVWPDPALRDRLAELEEIIAGTMYVEPGTLHLFYTRDWRPLPDASSFGHDVETAHLLLAAREELGLPPGDEPRRLVDQALDVGYDTTHGGLFYEGSAFRPPTDTTKVWWAQAEMLLALAVMAERHPDDARYAEALATQWAFVVEHQLHPEGGWLAAVSADGGEVVDGRRAFSWKAAYHVARALLETRALLDG